MKKNIKIDFNSPVILGFVIISFISLILGYLTGGLTTNLLFTTYRSSLLNPLTYVRMFTHVLGHANVEHFVGNMTLFLVVGPMLEEKYGSKNLLIMIALTAFITSVIMMLFNTGLLGASGVVFMMIMLSSITSVKSGKIPLTMIIVAILYLGGEIITGITQVDNISQLGHIIGGVLGCFYGFMLNSSKK